jgi:succinate dehydrogenase/fumarate reductase cytochrome b subunit
MSAPLRFSSSSIATQVLIALTGLAFALFLVEHMVANLLVLFNPAGYNAYSHRLLSNPLIQVATTVITPLNRRHLPSTEVSPCGH